MRVGLWQRLMMLVLGTVMLMWFALAATNLVFARFQRDFAEIATAQVPRIALTGEIASQSARLTTLATRIIGDEGASDGLIEELGDVSASLEASLAGAVTDSSAGNSAMITDLRDRIAALVPLTERRRQQAEEMAGRLDALRWLNVDIQDEIDPLLSDYDFNIRAKMLEIEDAQDGPSRELLLQQIAAERVLRDEVLQLGTDAGTVVTLLLQSAVSQSQGQIDQLSGLGLDMQARLTERISRLPEGIEFLTLRQSVELLRQSFDLQKGLLALRSQMLELDARIFQEIGLIQQGLTDLQNRLSQLGEAEKHQALSAISSGVTSARWTMAALAALTLLLGAAGITLIFGVMRRRIVMPLRALTSRMLELSESSGTRLRRMPRQDEIGRIRTAVDDFARAIEARDSAISELKQTQADLVQTGKMAALGNLSAGISHELNQPLTALRYRLMLLDDARQSGNTEEAERQLNRIADLTGRMQAIIAHLVRFARRADSQREPVALARVVEDATDLLKTRFDVAAIRPQIGPGIEGITVLGVAVLIEQVVVNLLTNALDAVADQPDGRITVDAAPDGQMIALSVTDNGTGLGDLHPEDALNPFVTTKSAGRGMGLGLSISYNIAKDMGGDLRLVPARGGGVSANLLLQKVE
ncbi:ATP-binding protein [Paracoccus fistulariae]|uniref:histidine kinase n=1 Tax=Paracoccus fistulariae TaxID=658446 RepID=A0ABY7SIT4_9RHOB|nr:ATP-binding protein [Paracoccus fistulariae]MDB6180869.1 ATP-binding protein [Paracoccus fistulariae]WCR06915.1 hypothetical protein JHX87_15810 [Paracoccus fistulariae]